MSGKTDDKIAAAMKRLAADPDGNSASQADLIIEAVAERLDVKKAVFQAVEAVARPDAILATNTSAIRWKILPRHCSRRRGLLACISSTLYRSYRWSR